MFQSRKRRFAALLFVIMLSLLATSFGAYAFYTQDVSAKLITKPVSPQSSIIAAVPDDKVSTPKNVVYTELETSAKLLEEKAKISIEDVIKQINPKDVRQIKLLENLNITSSNPFFVPVKKLPISTVETQPITSPASPVLPTIPPVESSPKPIEQTPAPEVIPVQPAPNPEIIVPINPTTPISLTKLQKEGKWSTPKPMDVVGIQAATVANGKILLFDGTEGAGTGDNRNLIYQIYDTATQTSEKFTAKSEDGQLLKYAAFCASLITLPNGNVFFAGGDVNGDAIGSKKSAIFNVYNNNWSMLSQMTYARWYPSAIQTLLDQVLVVGGTEDSYSNPASTPEIYTPSTDTWKTLPGADDTNDSAYGGSGHFYPWLYNLSNGIVANLGPRPTISLISTENNGGLQNFAPRDLYDADSIFTARMQTYGSVARFSANQVLVAGGGIPGEDHVHDKLETDTPDIFVDRPTETANIINLSELLKTPPGTPVADLAFTQQTANPNVPRSSATFVILPDGKVMLTGGTSLNEGADRNNQYDNAVLTPELWDKDTNSWSNLAPQQTKRIYHSISLLQKDGTIFQAGGSGFDGQCSGDRGQNQVTVKGLNACRQYDIYTPGYLLNSNGGYKERPIISSTTPTNLAPAKSFDVTSDKAISKVTFVLPGSVTHATNIQQYFMDAKVNLNGKTANITLPDTRFAAPKGLYFMFVWDTNGTPSIAQEIQIN